MGVVARLGAYGLVLATVFGAAWGVGHALGPDVAVTPASGLAAHPHDGSPHQGHAHAAADGTDGLAGTAAGYTMAPLTDSLNPGEPGEYAFTITGSDGAPVTAFDDVHDRPMHLVVVRRDATGFVHVHPELGTDGVWRAPLTLPAGGVYRAYADFTATGGPPLTLGADLFAPGEFVPEPPSAGQLARGQVADVDGYRVRLDGDLVAGTPSPVVVTVSRDSVPVDDLQPYLGAFGHLVALRTRDLSYLHVHPDPAEPAADARAGREVAFTVDVPTEGSYRLFLDFRHDDTVRTAEFTVATRDGR